LKVGNLPVVQANKFELIIKAQTARMLGLTVPPSLLAIADEVIDASLAARAEQQAMAVVGFRAATKRTRKHFAFVPLAPDHIRGGSESRHQIQNLARWWSLQPFAGAVP